MQTLDTYLMLEIDIAAIKILEDRPGTPRDVPLGELLTPEVVKEAIAVAWEGYLDTPDGLPGGVNVGDIYTMYENTRQLENSVKGICGMVVAAGLGFAY